MTPEERAERLQRLELDVDTRLAELWEMAWRAPVMEAVVANDLLRGAFATFMRAAYGLGYKHALEEVDDGRPGELARANGYPGV